MTRFAVSAETCRSRAMKLRADVGAADANVLQIRLSRRNTPQTCSMAHTSRDRIHMMMVIHHLYAYDQFLGFSGSSGPSHVTNSLVPSVCDTSCAVDGAASLADLSSPGILDCGSAEALLAGLSTIVAVGESSDFM